MISVLYETLQRRLRPEDVAELILGCPEISWTATERRTLDKAAAGSLKRSVHAITSMAEDFVRPVPPARQAGKARELFATLADLAPIDAADPEKVAALVGALAAAIRKDPGRSDYKADRLNRGARADAGLDLSRRRYNKLFRFVARFERKLARYRRELRKYAAVRIAKAGFATRIERADFAASPAAACFVAYYAARRNRRSVFTNQRQDPAFDDIARMLLARFSAEPCEAGWWCIAQVMPDRDAVAALPDRRKADLLVAWLRVLNDIAGLMAEVWRESGFDQRTMVVRRGQDSSTWNALAGAWNAARDGWLATVHALGLESELDRLCLGKAMRVMAADVVAWHQATRALQAPPPSLWSRLAGWLGLGGGAAAAPSGLHPDTYVWAALPLPWDVLAGAAICTRADVERACRRHGVDPVKSGWVARPPGPRAAVAFRPTPELVHGVAVSDPELAAILRRAGWFSGKWPVDVGPAEVARVLRDPTGAAIGVVPAPKRPR